MDPEKRVQCTHCGKRFESVVECAAHVRKAQDHPATVAALVSPPAKAKQQE